MMNLIALDSRPDQTIDKKLNKQFTSLEKLIKELNKRDLPTEVSESINSNIKDVNDFTGSNRNLKKEIRKSKNTILRTLETVLKLVPKNHYMVRWMSIGLGAFGVPMGVVFGAIMGNMALLGVGIPIGMVIGMAIGMGMDKKALDEGRQLDMEL